MSIQSTVGAYQAKSHFSELLAKVEAGEEFTITKHGMPIARLVPIEAKTTAAERHELIQRWLNRSDKPSLAGLKVRNLINEGRR